MASPTSKSRYGAPLRVRLVRWARTLHGAVSLGLLLLVVISSVTGLLLGWKKASDTLQPPTREAPAEPLAAWRTIDELATIAVGALAARQPGLDGADLHPERFDLRPDDGMAKVLFADHWEVQVEGVSGQVRSVARRHSDWIEAIHDGSIFGETFKRVAMTTLGVGLLVLSASGFWMWYGVKRLRRIRLAEKRES